MNSLYYLHNIPSDVFSHHIFSRLDECSVQRVALTSTRLHKDKNLQERLKVCDLFNSPCQTLRRKFEGRLLGGSSQLLFFDDLVPNPIRELQSFDLRILKSCSLHKNYVGKSPKVISLGNQIIIANLCGIIVLQRMKNGSFNQIQSYKITEASIFKRDKDSVVIANKENFWTLNKKGILTQFSYPFTNKHNLELSSFQLAGEKLLLNYSDFSNKEIYTGVLKILDMHQGKLVHEIETVGNYDKGYYLAVYPSIAASKTHLAIVNRPNIRIHKNEGGLKREEITIFQADDCKELSKIVLEESKLCIMKIHKQKLFCLITQQQGTFLKMFDLHTGEEEWNIPAALIPFELTKDHLILSNPHLKPEVWNWKHQKRIFLFNHLPLMKPHIEQHWSEKKIFQLRTGTHPHLAMHSTEGLKFWDLQFSETLKDQNIRTNWQEEQQIITEMEKRKSHQAQYEPEPYLPKEKKTCSVM